MNQTSTRMNLIGWFIHSNRHILFRELLFECLHFQAGNFRRPRQSHPVPMVKFHRSVYS